MTQIEQAKKIYDYIARVTKTQGRLLPLNILYGDGSKFEHASSELWALVFKTTIEVLQENKAA